mgnify:CR=1 FL=1
MDRGDAGSFDDPVPGVEDEFVPVAHTLEHLGLSKLPASVPQRPLGGWRGVIEGQTLMSVPEPIAPGPACTLVAQEELLDGAFMTPTYGNTLMGLASSAPSGPFNGYKIAYYPPQPRAAGCRSLRPLAGRGGRRSGPARPGFPLLPLVPQLNSSAAIQRWKAAL